MRQETLPREPRSILEKPAAAALYALATLVLAAAAWRAVAQAHADRMRLSTGEARWIWFSAGGANPRPISFYATREFVLPRAPSRALAKVFVDRRHTLYVNGVAAGGASQRPGDSLRVYRIAPLLRPGLNRVAIEASSPTGVGGILFALDLDGFGRDAVVSDRLWRVDSSSAALTSGGRFRPIVWGKPPQYPWGYPRMPRPNELKIDD